MSLAASIVAALRPHSFAVHLAGDPHTYRIHPPHLTQGAMSMDPEKFKTEGSTSVTNVNATTTTAPYLSTPDGRLREALIADGFSPEEAFSIVVEHIRQGDL